MPRGEGQEGPGRATTTWNQPGLDAGRSPEFRGVGAGMVPGRETQNKTNVSFVLARRHRESVPSSPQWAAWPSREGSLRCDECERRI